MISKAIQATRQDPQLVSIRGEPRFCPVCGSAHASEIFSNRMVPCAGYDFSAPIMRCGECDSAYAGTALAADDLSMYYSNFSKYDSLPSVSDISRLDRDRAAMGAAFLAPLIATLDSALDVGCSTGLFLSALREAGVKSVQGIDPAAHAAAAARSLFDVEVATAQAETFARYGDYDLVCLMAVLEHLREPRRLLEHVSRQLKPHARVLVEVPDAGAFHRPGSDEPLEAFGEFSNEHINFLSVGDIRKLARTVGLEVERWKAYRSANGAPGFFALLQRGRAPTLAHPDSGSTTSGTVTGDAVLKYVARCERVFGEVEQRLSKACRGDILVYGAGNHTSRLMAQSEALRDCRVLAVFDRNPHLRGASIGHSPVLAPDRIREYPDLPIIVSSFNARHEIQAALMASTRQSVIPLYL